VAADYTYDGAASVRGVALRVTSLDAVGAPDDTADCPAYITTGFIRLSFTPEYSDGDEVEIKNASGEICVGYKLPDVLKQVTFSLELCDPDPILTQKLVGGTIIADQVDPTLALGYASEMVGNEATPNGVAIEVWANAVIGGKNAGTNPYWHYLFPYAQMKFDGERVIESGNLATVFAGRGVGNSGFGAGPTVVAGAAYTWPAPQLSERPFAYMRVDEAPTALLGCYALL